MNEMLRGRVYLLEFLFFFFFFFFFFWPRSRHGSSYPPSDKQKKHAISISNSFLCLGSALGSRAASTGAHRRVVMKRTAASFHSEPCMYHTLKTAVEFSLKTSYIEACM